MNCLCGKILARGQNACTRHPARPRFAGASSVQEDLTLINTNEILDTIRMIDQQHLDIRTITMGISLLDCADPDPKAACQKIYDKITRRA